MVGSVGNGPSRRKISGGDISRRGRGELQGRGRVVGDDGQELKTWDIV